MWASDNSQLNAVGDDAAVVITALFGHEAFALGAGDLQLRGTWPPKNASAILRRNPKEQETFFVVKGVKIDAFAVSVKVGNFCICLNHDGSIKREDGDSTTWIEADRCVLKKTEIADATMSEDGVELTRRLRTPENIAAITRGGMISKDR